MLIFLSYVITQGIYEITAENEYYGGRQPSTPLYINTTFFILLNNNKPLSSRSKREKPKMILYKATFHVDISQKLSS